jgi:hypothetical protein
MRRSVVLLTGVALTEMTVELNGSGLNPETQGKRIDRIEVLVGSN